MADNPGAGAQGSIKPARALRRNPADELDLADRLERLGSACAIECTALHEHRGDHIVAARGVGQQTVESVIRRARDRGDERMVRLWKRSDQRPQVPQMVMRIDDWQFGLEDRFGHGLSVSD